MNNNNTVWKNAAGPVDQFGVYQDTDDGTYYLADGTPLYWYDPSTGNYEEEGDSTIYDANGNAIGNADSGQGGGTSSSSGSSSIFGSIWNAAKGFLGTGTAPTPVGTTVQPLVQSNNTTGLILTLLAGAAAVGIIIYVVKNNKKE